jgi:hypothetical protein
VGVHDLALIHVDYRCMCIRSSSSGDAPKPASKGLFGGLFGGKNTRCIYMCTYTHADILPPYLQCVSSLTALSILCFAFCSRNTTTVDDDSYSIMSGDPVIPNRSPTTSGASVSRGGAAAPSVTSSSSIAMGGSGRPKVFMEGYMTKKGGNSGPLGAESWTRRYFVLKVRTSIDRYR